MLFFSLSAFGVTEWPGVEKRPSLKGGSRRQGGGCGADVNCAHTSPSSCLSLPVPGAADGRKSFHVSASRVPGSAEADGRRVAASTYDQLVAWGPLDRLVNR